MNRIQTYSPTVAVGYFDSIEAGVAKGWAFDRRAPLQPQTLHVIIDGQEVDRIQCGEKRADIQTAFEHPTGLVGFAYEIPLSYFDGEPHEIAFRFANRSPLSVSNKDASQTASHSIRFAELLKPTIRGYVDGMRHGFLHGWAVRTAPRSNEAVGGCTILVTSNGAYVTQVKADRWRGDVASAFGCDPHCGFQAALPIAFNKPYPQNFTFTVVPEGVELDNSPFRTSMVEDKLQGELIEISETMDRLYKEFVALRTRVNHMLPQQRYNLSDYNRWAKIYYNTLHLRVAAERAQDPLWNENQPLVSILCPTYRPLMPDFTAAVESVLAQTYQNWELVIVDDASKSPDLTKQIKAFCAQDSRIRYVPRKKNGNISEATNTASTPPRESGSLSLITTTCLSMSPSRS